MVFAGSSLAQTSCPTECPGPGSFDGQNCFVMSPPSGGEGFIWNNSLYVTSPAGDGSDCPAGSSWDLANCHIGAIPNDREAFIFDKNVYLKPVCHDPDGTSYWMSIDKIKIHRKSDRYSRDDVMAIGALYNSQTCEVMEHYHGGSGIAKVRGRDISKWVDTNMGVQYGQAGQTPVRPNFHIELAFYDKDICRTNSTKVFRTTCGDDFEYCAWEPAYGEISIPYDLLRSGQNHYRNLGNIEIQLTSHER